LAHKHAGIVFEVQMAEFVGNDRNEFIVAENFQQLVRNDNCLTG